MKSALLFIFAPLIAFSQQGVSVYGSYHQSMTANYVDYLKDIKNEGRKINLMSYTLGTSSQIYRDKHISIRLGLEYKYTQIHTNVHIDSAEFIYYSFNLDTHVSTTHTDIYYYKKDMKYTLRSRSVGCNMDVSYHFGRHAEHDIGILSNFYFIEYFRSFYSSSEFSKIQYYLVEQIDSYEYRVDDISLYKLQMKNDNNYLLRNFFTSAIDLQLYYQYNWNISDNFSLGVRASIGTNLYSDWKQFKKYVWAGFGVNVGFLKNEKVRLNKGELRK